MIGKEEECSCRGFMQIAAEHDVAAASKCSRLRVTCVNACLTKGDQRAKNQTKVGRRQGAVVLLTSWIGMWSPAPRHEVDGDLSRTAPDNATSMFRFVGRRALAQTHALRQAGRRPIAASPRTLATFHPLAGTAKALDTPTRTRPRRTKSPSTQDDGTEDITAEVAERNLLDLNEGGQPGSPITLRPYQEEAITACVKALEGGKNRIGVSSPTGSGKTTMFMNLIPRIPPRNGGKQVLILVGSVELAHQAENAARTLLPGYSVEVEQAKRVASGSADV